MAILAAGAMPNKIHVRSCIAAELNPIDQSHKKMSETADIKAMRSGWELGPSHA